MCSCPDVRAKRFGQGGALRIDATITFASKPIHELDSALDTIVLLKFLGVRFVYFSSTRVFLLFPWAAPVGPAWGLLSSALCWRPVGVSVLWPRCAVVPNRGNRDNQVWV